MESNERQIATSVLVLVIGTGGGGGGLRAAIELAERGVDVLTVGKRPKADAHTSLAAGGINAALHIRIWRRTSSRRDENTGVGVSTNESGRQRQHTRRHLATAGT